MTTASLSSLSRPMAVLLSVVVAGACASSNDAAEPAQSDGVQPALIEPTPTPLEGEEVEEVGLPEEQQGVLVNRFDLDPAECFNTYGIVDVDDEDAQPETRVIECSIAHESEVYLQRNFPAGADEPYPGEEDLERWAEQQCYAEFEAFVGAEYELSALQIGVIHPSLTTWTGPGLHREVTCFVYSASGGGLEGSMANSGI